MIWETTLKKITDETANRAANKWVKKPTHLKLINNQINCVYRFESKNQGFYLRMTHEKIRKAHELLSAIDFQKHLFLCGTPICEPVVSQEGNDVETVHQDDLEFFVHVCREVPGQIMNFDYPDKKAYLTWGRALGLLHQASQSYVASEHHFLTWEDLWRETWDYARQEEALIQDLYQTITTRFKTFSKNSAHFGLTHGDHRPGNVLYDGESVHLIDFDEPVYHWYLADIAKPFLDLCNKPWPLWKPLFEWFIEGYRQIRPLSSDELKEMNHFSQMKSLDIYLWCKYNWFEETAPGGKPRNEWLHDLKTMALTPLFYVP